MAMSLFIKYFIRLLDNIERFFQYQKGLNLL